MEQAELNNILYSIHTYDTYIKRNESMVITNVMIVLILLSSEHNVTGEEDSRALKTPSILYS